MIEEKGEVKGAGTRPVSPLARAPHLCEEWQRRRDRAQLARDADGVWGRCGGGRGLGDIVGDHRSDTPQGAADVGSESRPVVRVSGVALPTACRTASRGFIRGQLREWLKSVVPSNGYERRAEVVTEDPSETAAHRLEEAAPDGVAVEEGRG